ncbi:MAG TPA: hypothetical protein VM368_03165 [Flavisolibacter sp.]|nr:hypothetical protein [Flavisolibacter sp.]
MNNKILIAAAGVAIAGIATYFIRRGMNNKQEVAEPVEKSHHLTNAFAHAKKHALSAQETN